MNVKKIALLVILACLAKNSAADGPLYHNWSFTLKAGVVPMFLTDRGSLYFVDSMASPPVFKAACEPNFSELWSNHSLIFDADLAYALADDIELFAEFAYRRAKPDSSCFAVNGVTDQLGTITLCLDSFRSLGGYLGLRYFSCRYLYERMSFFIGAKLGLMHYQDVSTSPFTFIDAQEVTFSQNACWFEPSTVVSGGVQVGFDCLLTCSWSLFFNAEVVAAAAPKPVFNMVKENETVLPTFTNIMRERSGTLVAFPITLGLRYYFW